MNNFTHPALRPWLRLFLKFIICIVWLLCIVSAAISRDLPLPHLGQNPGNQTVCSGSSPTFTIGAVTGTSGTTTIQWEVSVNGGNSYSAVTNGASYSGATTATLTVLNVPTSLNGNRYRCTVTDGTGSSSSTGALLTVNATPAVSSATTATTVCEGAPGSGLKVANDPALTYQWQVSTNNGVTWSNVKAADGYTGGTTNDLTYPTATLSMNGYLYRYTATNSTTGCSATSVAMDTFRVLSIPVFPGGSEVKSATICPGGNAIFTANPTGVAAMVYKWQVQNLASGGFVDVSDDAVYSGTQTKTLNITGFPGAAGSSWNVQMVVSYPGTKGCANSSFAGLSIRTLPAIPLQPKDTTVCANSPAGFKVIASGSATLAFQWQTDNGTSGATWSNVTGTGTANTNTLQLGPVTLAMNGYRYRVTVSNSCAPPATSNEKILTVRRSGTWLGYKDTKWEEAMNWCGGVPDNTIEVLVPNWPSRMPNISDGTGTAYFKSLEIENTARLTISGGTVNNMTGPFNLQGTVAYTATRDQYIFPAAHGSLEINGTDNKILSTDVDVSHNLVLGGSAKLVTGTNILTMKTGSNPVVASAFNDPAPATSWIVTGNGNAGAANTGLGGLRIEQVDASDGAVLFPVGPTPVAYNPLQLTNGGTVDHFTVAVNDQRIPGGVYGAGLNRTWLVSEAVNGDSKVMLSLKWQGNEQQASFDRTQSQIIRSNGTMIVESSAKAPASGSDPYARADGAFTVLTQFSVASPAVVLAAELSSFTAQKTGNAAVGLTWKATDASSARYFDVQRSADGIHFVTIARVNGETGRTAYNYNDNLPGTGMVYYRLLVMDQQSELVRSSIQSVSLNSSNLVQLRPSTTAGAITNVYMQASKQSIASLYITDIAGHIHSRQSLPVNNGENLVSLWIGNLGKGVYYVHVKNGDGSTSVLTLLKQ